MFIGHYALAFGAKKVAPSVSLGTAFLACQFADLLWPSLLMLGVETVEIDPGNTLVTPLNFVSYPYSHSLVMLVVWSALFALVYRAIRGWNPAGDPHGRRAGVQPLRARPDHASARPADHDQRIASRLGLGLWNYPGRDAGAGDRALSRRHDALHERHPRARWHRPPRPSGR